MQTRTFKAGDTIISEGADGNTAFLITSGSVEVSVGEGAKAKALGTLAAGEVFGEMCLIEPGPRSATVKAAKRTISKMMAARSRLRLRISLGSSGSPRVASISDTS